MQRDDLDEHLPLNPTEFLVLLVLDDGPLHGYGLVQGIQERTGGKVSPRPGNLYRVLDRLLDRGWITLADIEREARGGPKPARVFRLTDLGRRLAVAEIELRSEVLAGSNLSAVLAESGADR